MVDRLPPLREAVICFYKFVRKFGGVLIIKHKCLIT